MTCPGFSDRDDALRADMMGPPTGEEHLRAAMRVSTDPRWVERQLSPPPDSSGVHWEIVAAGCIGTVLAVAIVTAAVVYAFPAKAAEHPRPYEITMLLKDQQPDRRNILVLGQPYDSKTECQIAITRVKVMVSGARLRCDRIEDRRVK